MPKKKTGRMAWNAEEFGKRLDAWIAAHPTAQIAEFAVAVGCSVSQVHRLRKEGADPGYGLVMRIADEFGCEAEAFCRPC